MAEKKRSTRQDSRPISHPLPETPPDLLRYLSEALTVLDSARASVEAAKSSIVNLGVYLAKQFRTGPSSHQGGR